MAQRLVHGIGGNCARSELDRLSEPLRKMASQHAEAKRWLEGALASEGPFSVQAAPGDKLTFQRKILA